MLPASESDAGSVGYVATRLASRGSFRMGRMTDVVSRIAENLNRVRQRIAAAAARGGRAADAVKLVAVTKYVGLEQTRALATAECLDLGESRPQELWGKAELLADPAIHWHLIGHLQRNKIRRVLPHVALLHAGDSEKLLAAVNEEARVAARCVPMLLEVNISGDAAKHGFAPAELESLVPKLAQFECLDVRGLMAMAGLESDAQQTRREFASVRELRDRLQRLAPATTRLDELSMGMSGDFEIAIEEGATIVRVGSALFEGILP